MAGVLFEAGLNMQGNRLKTFTPAHHHAVKPMPIVPAGAWVTPLLMCAAGGIIPITLYARITGPNAGSTLLLMGAMYAGARLAVLAIDGRGRIIQLFFWFYTYFFLTLAPIAQMSGQWPWPAVVTDQEIFTGALTVAAMMISYEVARLLATRRKTRPHDSVRPLRKLSGRRMAVLIPAMILASIGVMFMLGGPSRLLQTRDARFATISQIGTSNASVGLISTALVATAFVSAYLMIVARRQKLIKGWALTTFLVVLLALFVTNPLSTNRYTMISVWAGILLAHLWPLSRRNFTLLTAGMIVGLIVVFPWLNQFRRSTSRASVSGDLHAMLNHGDYDSFQQITSIVAYVTDEGHTWGHQILSAAFFWVPRSVWTGKSIDTGVLAARHEGYTFVNLAAPLPGEAYIDFGMPGVIALFAALGAFTVWAERRASNPATLTTFAGLFVPIFAVYQVIILRGSLLQAVGSIAVVAVLLFAATSREKGGRPKTPTLNSAALRRRTIAPRSTKRW